MVGIGVVGVSGWVLRIHGRLIIFIESTIMSSSFFHFLLGLALGNGKDGGGQAGNGIRMGFGI